MKIRIDPERCSGHGRCYAIAPDVFDEDEAGYPIPHFDEVPLTMREATLAAQLNCPEQAIELVEDSPEADLP